MLLYRMGNWFFKKNVPVVPKLFDLLIRLIHNSAVYSESAIGKGTVFGYGGIAVVIHKRAVIGRNCVIGTGVTIGGRSRSVNVPVVGDNVYIAAGARILGDIKVGDNCVVGANAVVIHDVGPGCVVVGVPAKVIKQGVDAKDFY